MKARRALVWVLVAGGCFGLGLVVARWAGWGPPPTSVTGLPANVPAPSGTEPLIYIDAGAIELYDGSLTIHPPSPPDVNPR